MNMLSSRNHLSRAFWFAMTWTIIVPSTHAQELPNPLFQIDQFNNEGNFRQDICDLQARLERGETSLEHALEGLELRSVVSIGEYFHLNAATGGIDEEDPGMLTILMDEIARRGRFTWRNSFAVTGGPIANKTWTDLVDWTTSTYDISVDWWAHSIERTSMGVGFPEGWYDASIIMVAKTETEADKSFNVWNWMKPFDTTLWWCILFTIIMSGLLYALLEKIDSHTDRRDLKYAPVKNILLAGVCFTRQYDYTPRTHPGRLLTASTMFWAMLAASAYTANLASVLVVPTTTRIPYQTVHLAMQENAKICVFKGTQSDEALMSEYPNARNVIRMQEERDQFEGVLNGICDVALTTASSWEYWQRSIEINGACSLEWIGETFLSVPAGFSTRSDSGNKCTSLIRDVFNIHLLRMKEENFLKETWEDYMRRPGTIDCTDESFKKVEGISSQRLDLKSMGGIFVFHYVLSVSAIIAAWVYKYFGYADLRDLRAERRKRQRQLDKINKAKRLMERIHHQNHSRDITNGGELVDDLSFNGSSTEKTRDEFEIEETTCENLQMQVMKNEMIQMKEDMKMLMNLLKKKPKFRRKKVL